MNRDGEPIVPHGPPVSQEELIEQVRALMDLYPPVPTRWDDDWNPNPPEWWHTHPEQTRRGV